MICANCDYDHGRDPCDWSDIPLGQLIDNALAAMEC